MQFKLVVLLLLAAQQLQAIWPFDRCCRRSVRPNFVVYNFQDGQSLEQQMAALVNSVESARTMDVSRPSVVRPGARQGRFSSRTSTYQGA